MQVVNDNPMWREVAPYVLPKMSWGDPWYLSRMMRAWNQREEIVTKYSWAIASPDALQFVAQHSNGKLVEMGAGTGYWAALLSLLGVDVMAYDHRPPHTHDNYYHKNKDIYYDIKEGTPEVLAQHGDRTLFLCWPPYDNPMGQQCLLHYFGNKVIVIGEPNGGCTGDKAFFDTLETRWREVECYTLPQWDGIHDTITVHERIDIIEGEVVKERLLLREGTQEGVV